MKLLFFTVLLVELLLVCTGCSKGALTDIYLKSKTDARVVAGAIAQARLSNTLSFIPEENLQLIKNVQFDLKSSAPSDWLVMLTDHDDQISILREVDFNGDKYQFYYSNSCSGYLSLGNNIKLGDYFLLDHGLIFGNEKALEDWKKAIRYDQENSSGYRSESSNDRLMIEYDDQGNKRKFYYDDGILVRCDFIDRKGKTTKTTFERDGKGTRILKTKSSGLAHE